MRIKIEEVLNTPVTKEYDVVVVGGGPAGVCAAIASARGGASTLLAEREGYLGGMLTGGLVGTSGIYTVSPSTLEQYAHIRSRLKTDPDSVQLIKGVPRELMRRLIKEKGGIGYYGEVPAYVCVHVPSLKLMLMKMMEEENVDVLLYAQGIKPVTDGKTVKGVILQGKGEREAILAKVVIDATGDGDIAAAAGAEHETGRPRDGEPIMMTLMFSLGNIDMEKYYLNEARGNSATWPPVSGEEHLKDMRAGNSAWFWTWGNLLERQGVPESLRREIESYNWEMKHKKGHVFACSTPVKDELNINVTSIFKKLGTSSWDLTDATKTGYKQIGLLLELYKRTVKGFENAYIREIAPMMGVRETRRITGDYTLTGDDVRSSRKFSDGIAGSSHPIDTPKEDRAVFEKLDPGKWFEVPYRSLLVKGFEGILTAGRCISVDHEALGSVRPTAACMAIGEAAGSAAAAAAGGNILPRSVKGEDIRKKIGWGQ